MKKRFVATVLSALMALTLLIPSGIIAANEYVFFDSFETEFTALPPEWTYFGDSLEGCSEINTGNASDGNNSIKITSESTEHSAGLESKTFAVEADKEYTAAADVFIHSGVCTFYIKFQDASRKEVGSKSIGSAVFGDWTTITVTETAPSNAVSATVVMYISDFNTGSISFDNIRVGNDISVETGDIGSEATQNIFESEIEFLKSVEVLEASFNEAKLLLKGELAAMIAKVMYPDMDFSVTASEDSPFKDVDKNHKYYPYIRACKDLKIITGDSLGYFYPDNQVTMIEAVTVIVNALGYSVYANAYGGYPLGYYNVARDIGMLKGISMAQSDKLSGATVAKLIYNSLFSSLVVFDGITGSAINVRKDSSTNLLAERMGIKQYDAIVADNGITSLMESSMNDTQRVVLRETSTKKLINAYAADTNIGEYLGTRVEVFIKNNEENARDEVVYFTVSKSVKQKEIDASTVLHVNSSYIEYEADKASGKIHKLKLNSPIVIFNGIKIDTEKEKYLTFKDGILRCVDNGEGGFEFIEAFCFNSNGSHVLSETTRNIVFDKLGGEGTYLNCKFNPISGVKLDSDVASYKLVRSGDIKSIDDIAANSIVSIAESPEPIDGKRFYFLIVSTKTAEGTIESVSTSSSEITVDGAIYTVSTSLLSVKEKYIDFLGIGGKITLYLDVVGKVAYSTGASQQKKNYAYMIDTAIDTGFEGGVLIKLFLNDGTIQSLRLSDKAKIDGATAVCEAGETLYQAQFRKLTSRYSEPVSVKVGSIMSLVAPAHLPGAEVTNSRPVIVEINSQGLISSIDTDTPNHAVNPAEVSEEEAISYYNTYYDQSYIRYSDDEIDDEKTLKAAFRSPRLLRYRTGTFEGRFYVNSDTVIMNVPDIDTYGLNVYRSSYTRSTVPEFNTEMIKLYENSKDDENYKILPSFNATCSYDAQAYDVDPNTGVAALVVVRGIGSQIWQNAHSSSSPMLVFLKKSEVYDPEKERIICKIYYTQDGKTELSALADMEELPWNYKSLILGSDTSNTLYNKEVIPLAKGDIIRVAAGGGILTHIERVARVENIKNDAYGSSLFPAGPASPYTAPASGSSIPFDVRLSWSNFSQTYSLFNFYVRKITGNSMTAIVGLGPVSAIRLADNTTFCDQYINVQGGNVTVIEKKEDGSVNVKEGTYSDIITTESAGSLKGASLVICRHAAYTTSQLLVLNGFTE